MNLSLNTIACLPAGNDRRATGMLAAAQHTTQRRNVSMEDLELEFAGLEWAPVGEHRQRRFSKLAHAALPVKSWRTYHPGYLSRGHWTLVEEVCAGLA